jgi:hypothetical protein
MSLGAALGAGESSGSYSFSAARRFNAIACHPGSLAVLVAWGRLVFPVRLKAGESLPRPALCGSCGVVTRVLVAAPFYGCVKQGVWREIIPCVEKNTETM